MIVKRLLSVPKLAYSTRLLALNEASASSTYESTAEHTEKKWDVSVGLALIRPPIIAPEMTEIERKYDIMCKELEHQNSLMSDFELCAIKDKELLLKRQKLEDEGRDLSQLDEQIGVTAIQKEDDWSRIEETAIKEYKLDDIRSNQVDDPKSLRYKLDRKLVLMVKQQLGSTISPWILPQLLNSGETLRQTAERCLGETFTSDINVSIDGNAPMNIYRYIYPKPIAKEAGSYGNLVFIYSAYVNELDRELKFNNSVIKDYLWCSSDQLDQLRDNKDRKYTNKIMTLLFE